MLTELVPCLFMIVLLSYYTLFYSLNCHSHKLFWLIVFFVAFFYKQILWEKLWIPDKKYCMQPWGEGSMRTGTALLFFFEALDFIISILSLFLTLTWCLRCCQAQPEPQLNWGLAGSIFILSNHPPRKVFSESFPQSLDSINRLVLVPKIDPLKKKVCLKMIIRQSTVFFFCSFVF